MRKLLAVLGLLVVAGTAIGIFVANQSGKVYFVNAFDDTMRVTVGPHDFTLNKDQRKDVELPKGDYHVRVTQVIGKDKEREVEVEDIKVEGGVDAQVYNIAGAAPVYASTVTYVAAGGGEAHEEMLFVGGQRFYTRDNVQYVFRSPPQSVSLSSSQKKAVYWRVDVAEKADWIDTVIYLAKENKKKEAVEVAARFAVLHPDDGMHLGQALAALSYAKLSDAAGEIGRRAVIADPKAMEAHRFYQNAMIAEGKRDALVAEYQKRLESNAGSADAMYLLLRILPNADRLPRLKQAVEAFPDSGMLRYSYMVSLLDIGQAKEAMAQAAVLDKLKMPETYQGTILDYKAMALVRLGKLDEAMTLASSSPRATMLIAQLTHQRNGKGGAEAITGMTEPLRSAWLNVNLDGDGAKSSASETEEAKRKFLALSEAVRRGPDETVTALVNSKLDVGNLTGLGQPLQTALAAALVKRGKTELAEAVFEGIHFSCPRAVAHAAVFEGVDSPEINEEPMEARASLHLALATHAKDAATKKKLLDEVRADEPIHGSAWQLANRWFD